MDFEQRIARGEDAVKWRGARAKDELPLWVADMDFACSPAIQQALHQRADEQIYGYTIGMDEDYRTIVCAYYERHFKWTIDPQELYFTNGVVQAISLLIRLLSRPGEGIVIQPPVYHPFRRQIEANQRRCVCNPLKRTADGRYEMDLDDLEERFQDPSVRGLIFCSPHNPVGRVWEESELRALADLAQRYDKWIISDEIHGDIIKEGLRHHPLAKVCEAQKARIITCTAPTKTFNMAGIECSHIIIHHPLWQAQWKRYVMEQLCISGPNCFAVSALKAAYTASDEWREQMNRKIDANASFACAYLREHLPLAKVTPREGTYLLWVDFSAYVSDSKELERLLREEARVRFNEGIQFGEEGACFERINLACPTALLEEALARVAAALSSHR